MNADVDKKIICNHREYPLHLENKMPPTVRAQTCACLLRSPTECSGTCPQGNMHRIATFLIGIFSIVSIGEKKILIQLKFVVWKDLMNLIPFLKQMIGLANSSPFSDSKLK